MKASKMIAAVAAVLTAFSLNAGNYSLTTSETWNDAKIAEMSAAYDGVELGGGATLTLEAAGDVAFALAVSGGGNLAKAGVGTLTLSGENTFTGELAVNAGVLKTLASSPTASTHLGKPSKVTVADGATLDISEAGGSDAADLLGANQPLYLAGSGFDGQGALRRMTGSAGRNSAIRVLNLTADATICLGQKLALEKIYLDGHCLTVDGTSNMLYLLGNTTKVLPTIVPGDGGSIVAKRDVYFQGDVWSAADVDVQGNADNSLTLASKDVELTLLRKKNPVPWTLNVTANAKLTGGDWDQPSGTYYPAFNTWSGPVAVGDSAVLTVNAAEGKRLTVAGNVSGPHGGTVLKTGAGTVRLAGGLNLHQQKAWDNDYGKLQMAAGSGLLEINGSVHLQSFFAYGGKCVLSNATLEPFADSGAASFYLRSSGLTADPACFSATNSTLNLQSRYLCCGDYSGSETSGIIDLDAGTTLETLGIALGGSTSGSDLVGFGALYQRGDASVSIVNSTSAALQLAAGRGSYAYYGMSGGSFRSNHEGNLAARGFAVVRQSGGTRIHAKDVAIATNGGEVVVWQSGGTSEPRYMFNPATPDGTRVTLAVEGTNTVCTLKGGTWNQRLGFSCLNAVTLTLAVNDGGEVRSVRLDRGEAPGGKSKFYASFDGGRLRALTSAYNFFDSNFPDVALVHQGGLTFDTSDIAASGYPSILDVGLLAPTGRIVTAIDLPTDEAFANEKFIGPPKVTIAGTGVAAAAVALFDENTRQVTGIRILAPGTGYDESTTATIESADRKKTYACVVTTAEAPTTGAGLRKVGAGTLEIRSTNTWRGPAVVEAGTLTFTGLTAVPEGMGAEVWKDATLNLGADIRALSDLKGCGAVTCSKSVSVTNALALVATNSTLTVTATKFTLADGIRIDIPNFDDVKDGEVENFALLSVPGGITYEGEVVLPDVGDGWKVRCKAKGIELKRHAGFSVILR